MNTKLVDSVIQLINSLPEEEQRLIQEKLNKKPDWETTKARIIKRGKAIEEREGDEFYDKIDDVFQQMREERSQELLQACLAEYKQEKV